MSTTTRDQHRLPEQLVSGSNKMPHWLLPASLAAVFLAFLPILCSYLPQLWSRQYYQFFPFAFLVTIVLAVSRASEQPNFEASKWRWAIRGLTFVFAEFALIGGALFDIPWAGFVAFVIVVGLVLDFWQDAGYGRSLCYLVLPLAIVVRPPLNLDLQAIHKLQEITSSYASAFLAALQIDHIRSGNVIHPLNGPALFVEEACSGVQSLFTLMFIAAFLGVYRRYTLPRTLLLVGASVFWALILNIFRVLTIAFAQTQLNLDLTTGWQHEMIGHIGILLAVAFLISTDQLLLFFISGIPDDAMKNPKINVFVAAWNKIFVSPTVQAKEAASTRESKSKGLWSLSNIGHRPVKMLGIGVAVLLFVSALPAWRFTGLGNSVGVGHAAVGRASLPVISPDETWLPASFLQESQLKEFNTQERIATSQLGQFSSTWLVETGQGDLLHSLDYPFHGWNDLAEFYRSSGWRQEKLEVLATDEASDNSDWPVVYAEFLKPTGEHAYLCFSLFSAAGTPIAPENANGDWSDLRNRLQDSDSGSVSIQVQTLSESLTHQSEESQKAIVEQHRRVREQLRSSATGLEVSDAQSGIDMSVMQSVYDTPMTVGVVIDGSSWGGLE